MRGSRRLAALSWPRLLGSLVLLCAATLPPSSVMLLPVQVAVTEVRMENFKFAPATISVAAGDTVSWTNTDNFTHNVTVDQGPQIFVTPELKPGQSTRITFQQPG